jgi:hypothetical protein
MEISCDDRFTEALPYIKQKIKAKNLSMRTVKKGSRHCLIITGSVDEEKLQTVLSNVVASIMKIHYLRTHLIAPRRPQINYGAFLRVLSAFDSKTDMIIAATLIKITPQIYLDSLFDFMLNPIHKRWAEIVRLVNGSMSSLLSPNVFNDFLRFLISNLDHKINEAHIMCSGSKTMICNDELTPLSACGGDIINELIDISPRTIFIHSRNDDIEKDLIKNIEQIFPSCVTILYANINN